MRHRRSILSHLHLSAGLSATQLNWPAVFGIWKDLSKNEYSSHSCDNNSYNSRVVDSNLKKYIVYFLRILAVDMSVYWGATLWRTRLIVGAIFDRDLVWYFEWQAVIWRILSDFLWAPSCLLDNCNQPWPTLAHRGHTQLLLTLFESCMVV